MEEKIIILIEDFVQRRKLMTYQEYHRSEHIKLRSIWIEAGLMQI